MINNSENKKNNSLIYGVVILTLIAIGVFAYLKQSPSEETSNFNMPSEISVNKTDFALNVGESQSFELTLKKAAGLIEVTSSDENVTTISTNNENCNQNSCFFDSLTKDGETISYRIQGNNIGKAKIIVKLTDVLRYDETAVVGSGEINVSVK